MSAGAMAAGTAITGLLDNILKQKADEDKYRRDKKMSAEETAQKAQMNSMTMGMDQARTAGKDEQSALNNLLGIFQQSYT